MNKEQFEKENPGLKEEMMREEAITEAEMSEIPHKPKTITEYCYCVECKKYYEDILTNNK